MRKVNGIITRSRYILYVHNGFCLQINVDYEGIGDIFYLFEGKEIKEKLKNCQSKFKNIYEPERMVGKKVLGIERVSYGDVLLREIYD